MKGATMKQRQPVVIDPLSDTSRIDQVYLWVSNQLAANDKPRSLPMNAVRTALSRADREKLLLLVNQQLGNKFQFSARWSGNRKGKLSLRLTWHTG